MHSVGWGTYEYIRKIMKVHTVDRSVNYHVAAAGKEDFFLCETETNGDSMILKLIRVLPRNNFVFRENYYPVIFSVNECFITGKLYKVPYYILWASIHIVLPMKCIILVQ